MGIYIAITDHSKSLTIAHGLDEARLMRQMDEIDGVNRRLKEEGAKFTNLKGMEADEMTERILTAMA